jgi:hypothetical protein
MFPLMAYCDVPFSDRSHGQSHSFSNSAMVMRAGDGGVHADQAEIDIVACRRLGNHRFHERLEDPGGRPHTEPVVDRRPGSVALRHVRQGLPVRNLHITALK